MCLRSPSPRGDRDPYLFQRASDPPHHEGIGTPIYYNVPPIPLTTRGSGPLSISTCLRSPSPRGDRDPYRLQRASDPPHHEGIGTPIYFNVPTISKSLHPEQYLDLFGRCCAVQTCERRTDWPDQRSTLWDHWSQQDTHYHPEHSMWPNDTYTAILSIPSTQLVAAQMSCYCMALYAMSQKKTLKDRQ